MKIKWLNKNRKSKQSTLDDEMIEKCSVYYISCDQIRSNAMRSRCDFDEDKLISLAYSIKRYGMIEPISIRQTDIGDSFPYEIITGERRFRAAKLAGLSSIPCIIIDVDERTSAELSLIENIYSEPLNYFESAFALQRIGELGENSFDDLASRLSISQSELNKKLWLLNLEYNERCILLNANISENVAVDIARITDKSYRRKLIDNICEKDMSESMIKELIKAPASEIDNFKSNANLPRDIYSAIKGIIAKINFLNRYKKRADIKIIHEENTVIAEIRIKY